MLTRDKKLRVFEAFAGIGAQATALERIGINYEIVGISDWFTDAIICYDAIHGKSGKKADFVSRFKKYMEDNVAYFAAGSAMMTGNGYAAGQIMRDARCVAASNR